MWAVVTWETPIPRRAAVFGSRAHGRKNVVPGGVVAEFFDGPFPRLGDESELDARRADFRTVRYLVGREEADAEAPDVFALE